MRLIYFTYLNTITI